MRAFEVGIVFAVVLAGTAWAEIEVDNTAQGWTEPKREVQLAQWPRDANGRLIFGSVLLDCAVAAGHADDCKVKQTEPTNPLLEKAALALAPLFTSKDASPARHQLEVSILYDMPPSWLHKPSTDQLILAWPREAAERGISGTARVKCQVNKQGLLQECYALQETPPGWGFGDAAVQLTPTFLMKPAIRNGEAVVSDITVPVSFSGSRPTDLSYPTLVHDPYWARTPDQADILKLLDRKVGDKFADGKVVLMCKLEEKFGTLDQCSVINASPGMNQFADVAEALAADFRVDSRTLAAAHSTFDGAKMRPVVFLPFSFPDMTSPAWSGRRLDRFQWTDFPDRSPSNPMFPEDAIKAGLKSGTATVDCLVNGTGKLSDCKAVKESTPGVGFGDTARKIAEASAINPWTEEGLPAAGARVQLPIQMDYTPPQVAPTPATKP